LASVIFVVVIYLENDITTPQKKILKGGNYELQENNMARN